MKIILLTEFFPQGKNLVYSGGVETRTFFIAKNLSKKHEVKIITSRQPKSKPFERMHGFEVYRVGPEARYTSGSPSLSDVFFRPRFFIAALVKCLELDFDIIDGGNFNAHSIAKIASIVKKKPVVFWYPDVFIGNWIKTTGLVFGVIGFVLEKINLKFGPNHFISISKETTKKLIKNGISPNKISIIYCGVSKNEFKARNKKRPISTIISVSRLVKYKRIKDLILAFALLYKSNKNLRLVLIGSGPEENSLKEMSEELKIKKAVTFLSQLPRNTLINKLQESDIFCLPSTVEGFGISAIEAASAGLPSVLSNIPIFKEITKKGKGAIFFEAEDPIDLSRKLKTLIDDQNVFNKKSKEALYLAKQYDWMTISKQTERLYKSLLNSLAKNR